MLVSRSLCDPFDRAARTYDEVSEAQRLDARAFCSWTKSLGAFEKNWPILEVGCGTGHLTSYLVEQQMSVLATDISPEMIAVCKQRLADKIDYQVIDGERIEIDSGTVVISAWAVQWFSNPVETLKKWSSRAEVFISLPVEGTFPEWRKASLKAGVPMSAYSLPVVSDLLDNLPVAHHHLSEVTLNYETPFHFFRSLKKMGATGNCTAAPLPLTKVIRSWDSPCQATYQVLYLHLNRFSEFGTRLF